MLSAGIILPESPEGNLPDFLQKIGRVEWNVLCSNNVKFKSTLENALLFSSPDILPLISELLIIFDPHYCNFAYLSNAIRNGCHIFLPDKLFLSVEERKELIFLAKEGGSLIQIKNDFLFQPSHKKIISEDKGTCFIEVHQSIPSWEEGKLQENLMDNLLLVLLSCRMPIHRADIFCGTSAHQYPDVLNIHLTFNNGSTASITLTFIEEKNSHKMKIYHRKGITRYNFRKSSYLNYDSELLTLQIESFIHHIQSKTNPVYSLNDELDVYLLMGKIREKIEHHFCDHSL